jgi:hypothetical protein
MNEPPARRRWRIDRVPMPGCEIGARWRRIQSQVTNATSILATGVPAQSDLYVIPVERNQDGSPPRPAAQRGIRCRPMADGLDDAVEQQVAAYNNHDVDTFVACYSENVVIEDDRRQTRMHGRSELRQRYSALFSAAPTLKATITSRIRIASYVVDEEHVAGHPSGDLHAVAIYHLGDDGLIDHVRLLY